MLELSSTTVVIRSYENINNLISQLDGLPLKATITPAVLSVLEDTSATLDEISRVIAQDPTIATRIIRTAQSAMFGMMFPGTGLTRAIQIMGLDMVREIVRGSSLLRIFALRYPGQARLNARLEGLWRHSVATGVAAQILCRRHKNVLPITYFAAGLLHDIGKAAFVLLRSEGYEEVVQMAQTERIPVIIAEHRLLDFDHARLGRDICEAWGQPEDICIAVGRHHSVRAGTIQDAHGLLTATIHVADILAHAFGVGWWGDTVMPRLDPAAIAVLNLSLADAHTLLDEIETEYPRTLAHLNTLFPDTLIA
jgi:putative nucleotidyltransferase with HDIG domain